MRKTPLFAALLLLVSVSAAEAFTAKDSTEAVMTFSHSVELITKNLKAPSESEVNEQIKSQLEHLFGPMEQSEARGVPKEDQELKVTSVKAKEGAPRTWIASYDYKGTILVQKGPNKTYDIFLPVNPDQIWKQARVNGVTTCTDPHYQTKGDYWYFWAPNKYPDCAIKEGVHYNRVSAVIDRLAPEKNRTYPEYHRMANKDGVIEIHMLFGKDEAFHGRDPDKSVDANAKNYVAIRDLLTRDGFAFRRWAKGETEAAIKGLRAGEEEPVVEEAVREFASRKLKIKVRLFYGYTQMWEKARPFHYFFRDALRDAAVLLYDGHSGLGGHLDIEKIIAKAGDGFQFQIDKDKYQVLFLNSCSSYTYYNSMYFARKRSESKGLDPKGTKNLDILSNGNSTDYDAESDLALVRAVINYAYRNQWTSYQTLARRLDTGNLFTVNGDEDNPKQPLR